ncbi:MULTISPECIES: hypothetical protein [unclassified Corallococcus]|nr:MULTISPECIES: hypothetical protein [unclassified Corallococcus]WAS85042.1 hypothetical protein O0N60_38030 [Corallococcus sp. NCRR]
MKAVLDEVDPVLTERWMEQLRQGERISVGNTVSLSTEGLIANSR